MGRWWGRARLFGCVLLAASALGCGGSGPFGPGADQGIDILALRGPVCPVETGTEECEDQPYQAWIQIRDQRGILVSRVQTHEDGRARVGLFPGLYIVHPESGDPFPTASEQQVTVVRDHFTEITVRFDTGIR